MGWDYKADLPGIGNYLNHSPELRLELHRRALLGVSMAKALAQHGKTSEHANSGHVEDDGPNGGVNKDRMQFSIVFNSPHSVPVTFPRKDPHARDYLLAAMAVVERGT
jgi:hypothetical protein